MKLGFLGYLIILNCIPLIGFSQTKNINQKLLDAAYEGKQTEVVKCLKDSANINTKSFDGFTPLMYASQEGHTDIVKILVHNNADINSSSKKGYTALLLAVEQNHEDIVNFLCQKGANIDTFNFRKVYPIHLAAIYGYLTIIDMLIYYGADIHVKDTEGNDALLYATYSGQTHLVEFLLDNGANIDTKDNNGFSPLMIAAQKGYGDIVSLILSRSNVKNKVGVDGNYSLLLSIQEKQLSSVDTLLTFWGKNNIILDSFTHKLAIHYENQRVLRQYRKQSAERYKKPVFNKVILSYNHKFSMNDVLWSNQIGVYDANYKVQFDILFQSRYGPHTSLLAQGNNNYYQVKEKSHFIGLQQSKYINIVCNNSKQFGILTSISESIGFGKYNGMDMKPKIKAYVGLSAGTYYQGKVLGIATLYEYFNTRHLKASPHWLNASIYWRLPIKDETIKLKKKRITWLEYQNSYY